MCEVNVTRRTLIHHVKGRAKVVRKWKLVFFIYDTDHDLRVRINSTTLYHKILCIIYISLTKMTKYYNTVNMNLFHQLIRKLLMGRTV